MYDQPHLIADMASPLPLQNETFDFVHTSWTLQYLPRGGCERFMAEARRLVRPSGLIIIRNMLAGTHCIRDKKTYTALGLRLQREIQPTVWEAMMRSNESTSSSYGTTGGRTWIFKRSSA